MDKLISGLIELAKEKQISPKVHVRLSCFGEPDSKAVATDFTFTPGIAEDARAGLIEREVEYRFDHLLKMFAAYVNQDRHSS